MMILVMSGWLLAGWLQDGWLAGWLAGWLTGRLSGWLQAGCGLAAGCRLSVAICRPPMRDLHHPSVSITFQVVNGGWGLPLRILRNGNRVIQMMGWGGLGWFWGGLGWFGMVWIEVDWGGFGWLGSSLEGPRDSRQ